MTTETTAAPFHEVFREELEAVLVRRRLRGDAAQPLPQPAPQSNPKLPEEEKELYERALQEDLCGLAISGGGIRSATFGLGVLQAFAVANFLPKFDYLSTVSGGGYIGAWFATWISRAGWKEVLAKLKPVQFHHSESGTKFEPDPEPIRHLRRYSNYLAPRIGLFSLDSWVLVSIYVRNLLLNQLVLALVLLSLFLLGRALVELFTTVYTHSSLEPRILFGAVLVLVMLFVCLVIFAVDSRKHFMAGVSVLIMLIVAVLGSLSLLTSHPSAPASGASHGGSLFTFAGRCWLVLLLGAMHGFIGFCIVLGRELARVARTLREANHRPSSPLI